MNTSHVRSHKRLDCYSTRLDKLYFFNVRLPNLGVRVNLNRFMVYCRVKEKNEIQIDYRKNRLHWSLMAGTRLLCWTVRIYSGFPDNLVIQSRWWCRYLCWQPQFLTCSSRLYSCGHKSYLFHSFSNTTSFLLWWRVKNKRLFCWIITRMIRDIVWEMSNRKLLMITILQNFYLI